MLFRRVSEGPLWRRFAGRLATLVAVDARLARLRWRCRRGMRELDALLLKFVDANAAQLTEGEIACFEAILELPDPTLHAYLLGSNAPPNEPTAALIERIRASVDADA
jgi:antitoxin CptB